MTLSVQEAIAARTEEALEDLIASVRRMPADKLDWRPLGEGRSAMDQFRECATAPHFYSSAIRGTPFVSLKGVREGWDVDECERQARLATADLLEAIRALPGERLGELIEVPMNGTIPVLAVVWMHLGNLTYHLGQIGFIQTLYGDLE